VILPFDVDVPPINPDFSAPFFGGLQVLASYVLAGAMLAVFIMLVLAAAALAFPNLATHKVQSWAGDNITRIFIAAAGLGAINGLFGWFVNFDFGF